MNVVEQALATQLANIEKRSGKTLVELEKIVKASGLEKHAQIVAMLKTDLGLGHGDANTVAHYAMKSSTFAAVKPGSNDEALDGIYTGPKAGLRPIHDKLMAAIAGFGEFEVAPKKANVSLRRKKQFATIGPATNTRVEVGLNMKGVAATARLEEMPPKSMCQYRVKLTDASEVDAELIAWIRTAFNAAG